MKTTKFKPSEVGPIPEEWEVKRLGDVADFMTATTPTASIDLRWYIGTENMLADKAGVTQNFASVPYKVVREYIKGDVLTSNIRPYLKKIWLADRNGGCSTDVLVLRTHDRAVCIPEFLVMLVSDDAFFDFAMANAVGTKMPRGDKKVLVNFEVRLPSVPEQQAIASALSDVDALLAAMTKLIEKKRAIKQGAMQELLTGKKRLAGFTGKWVEKRLGECGFCFNGITGKTGNDFGHGGAHYITFLNVLSNVVIDVLRFDLVDIVPGENQNEVRRGDLFFNTSSETPEEVGFCSVLDEEVESVYLNSFCFGFRLTDNTVSGKFMAYWFRSAGGRSLMSFLAQGSTRYNLSKEAFRDACVYVPSTLTEQRAIASVLSDMDAEIAVLEAKRAKYESIKQGMMQELLTGRTRLM